MVSSQTYEVKAERRISRSELESDTGRLRQLIDDAGPKNPAAFRRPPLGGWIARCRTRRRARREDITRVGEGPLGGGRRCRSLPRHVVAGVYRRMATTRTRRNGFCRCASGAGETVQLKRIYGQAW